MASSLGAMTAAAVGTGAMASSGLAFRDSALVSRGRLSSFVRPAVSRPVLSGITVGRLPAVGSSGRSWRAMEFDPLGDSGRASFGGMWDFEAARKARKVMAAPVRAAAADGDAESFPDAVPKAVEKVGAEGEGLLSKKALTTGSFFLTWYFLNVIFNILNKKLYNYFPFPYFVSVVHLSVGVMYCLVSWGVGAPKRAPIDNELWALLFPVAVCHALGHIMSNVSFAAVAVSFTHTIKALEPFFNAAASQFVLGEMIPIKLWLSLAPIVLGVSAASLTELSFNWTGFLSAMTANVAFTYRNIYSKKAMVGMDSTNVYAYISILSLGMCVPPAIIMEGKALMSYGFNNAINAVGLKKFLLDLFWVGMFYHLYNQLANNTLERVAPLTHAVGNVLKRVFVIVFSILVFGNKITTQTGIGTVVAIAGVGIYSVIKADMEEKKRALKNAKAA